MFSLERSKLMPWFQSLLFFPALYEDVIVFYNNSRLGACSNTNFVKLGKVQHYFCCSQVAICFFMNERLQPFPHDRDFYIIVNSFAMFSVLLS
jgi:hypothetical protein